MLFMTIKEWQIKHSVTDRVLAAKAGVTESAIGRINRGERFPRPLLANRLVEISKGEITLEDIYRVGSR